MKRRNLLLSGLAFGAMPIVVRANNDPAWKTTDENLREAISSIIGQGGRIVLPAGNYGMLHINSDFPNTNPLIIAASDPRNPPRFSDLDVYQAKNVILENLTFDYTFALGNASYYYPFRAWNSQNISIISCIFDGDVARGISPAEDNFPTGHGLSVRDTTGFHFEGCEIRGFLRGILVGGSSDVQILDNHIHGMRSDGMNFAEVSNVLIARNRVHDFRLSKEAGDHLDMIQFWTAGTSNPSRNVVIRDNLLYLGNENLTQSIFMRNELVDSGKAGSEMFYQDILIENNFILNSHLHGITVGEIDRLEIRNNTLVRDRAASGPDVENTVYIPRINIKPGSRNVEIVRNITAGISGHNNQADWKVAENFFVQDIGRLRPNFYEAVFVGGNWSEPSAYAARPGGPLGGTGIGARLE